MLYILSTLLLQEVRCFSPKQALVLDDSLYDHALDCRLVSGIGLFQVDILWIGCLISAVFNPKQVMLLVPAIHELQASQGGG
jgi:hypothetical protein